jgi:nitrogenase molybdenum-iron protein alpha/beta subunit
MVVCSQALLSLAREMRERWGIAYFEGSFYGIGDTSTSLRTLARLLVDRGAAAGLLDRTEALIAEEEERAWAALSPYRDRLQGKRVLLYTGGVKSWSVVSALQEIGMVVVGTSVRKSTEEDKERIKTLMGEDAPIFGQIPAKQMYAMLANREADILMSGGRTQFVALKSKTPWLDINRERHHGYAGYDGMIALVRRIDTEIHHPIWAQVRKRAPWDSGCPHSKLLPAGDGDPRQREDEGSAMTDAFPSGKACSVNPLKVSPALGGAMAFLGVEHCLPLLHGSQGCTAFALVLMVRHFRETIPLQTTAMSELTTILGGADNVEEAIANISDRAKPRIIGICSTALTETVGARPYWR